ncbi:MULTISPECIES: L,D-transpeptidase [unclassified Coleofasciculus]|uniref:L,D-transpeptidase n=1 Tax=unclassified Coleofasciculus TaxID=2692782 RepID=UPI0018823B0F|nr:MULTISPECIES: L,D-transpeptidase [unclassified Coleofasciculus]MBE9130252.1 L,D-transpeptidase [Coleofasciculus sp. LEGE 07081]MBE9152539.1 L,D-transpeptidase [Coleofasciculus sp. LEGE 07092]
MKTIRTPKWVRYSGTVLTGIALSATALGFWTEPAFPTPIREQIAARMIALQNSSDRWIQIDIPNQRLIAWEGGNQVYAVIVSTGKNSTPTRPGTFTIQSKRRTDRMRGQGYDVPNVPYAMYYDGGYAIHGAYWHKNFGTPVSHGCINVAVDHAEWLFNWASVGTPVVIHQ